MKNAYKTWMFLLLPKSKLLEPSSYAQNTQNRVSLLVFSQEMIPHSRCTGALFSQLRSFVDHLCLHCTGLMLGLYRYKKSISFLEVLKLVRITDAKVHRITFTIMSARLTRYTVAADQKRSNRSTSAT